jgi:excisionase family DNA binding protein
MSMLGVAEAAAELGVSPRRVRQMLADGVLDGERVGRAWVIGSDQLRQAGHRRPEVGRPWSSASAWAVLALADGGKPVLSPVERSRARKRLAEGLDSVARRLGSRADRRSFYAHPSVLDRLADVPGVVRAGASAAPVHGADLVVGEGFEGYVRAGELDGLVSQFGLDGQAARPNVLLRVVDDAVWPFQPGQESAGRAVVAMDLLESDEPRTQRAGAELLGVK